MTKIVHGRPPNFDAITAAFGKQRPTTIYAYGDTIYTLVARPLRPDLIAHEETHFTQQEAAGGADAWWARYIADPAFRLAQEIEAYRVQIAAVPDRASRRALLKWVIRELAGGDLYGRICTADRARELLAA